jgi:hypothetical protein
MNSNKFIKVAKLRKDVSIQLLDKLTFDELKSLIDIQDKNSLIKLITGSFTRGQINEIIYKSSLTEKDIIEIAFEKKITI